MDVATANDVAAPAGARAPARAMQPATAVTSFLFIARALGLGLSLAAVVGCEAGSLDRTGTAGGGGSDVGTGEGGAIGVGGDVGTGQGGAGGDGAVPWCGLSTPGASDTVDVAVLDADGNPVIYPVSAAVTVTSVDACTSDLCSDVGSFPGYRIVVSDAGQRQWSIELVNSAMRSSPVAVGDELDLEVRTSEDTRLFHTVDQTLTLAQNDALVVFAASMSHFNSLATPDLTAFGIVVADQGAVCQDTAWLGCLPRPHTIRLSVGSADAYIGPGQTVPLGGLSFTVGAFTELADAGSCDAKSATKMAGFRLP